MENRGITVRNVLFMLTGIVVIIGMTMNWLPVELNLGVAQFSDVLGKFNAFTLSKTVYELEETLGVLAGFLPEAFEELKIWSVIMAASATVTLILYVCGISVRILRKDRYVELVSLASATGAIMTAACFASVVTGIFDEVGMTDAGYSVMPVLMRSPWAFVVLAGIVSASCTNVIADILGEWIKICIKKLGELVEFIAEWMRIITDNLGFLVSDVIGAVVGIFAGKTIASMTNIVLLGVVAGLAVACLVATSGCVMTSKIFAKDIAK